MALLQILEGTSQLTYNTHAEKSQGPSLKQAQTFMLLLCLPEMPLILPPLPLWISQIYSFFRVQIKWQQN